MTSNTSTYQPMPLSPTVSAAHRVCGLAFLGIWGLGTSVVVASLMGPHLIPIPAGVTEAAGRQLAHASVSAAGWQAVHVLTEGCPCSAAVAEYLVRRGPANGVSETVWIAGAGEDLSSELVSRGFKIQRVTAKELHHAHGASVLGAPWLLLLDPQGNLAYSGGYAEQRPRPGVELEDLAILQQLQSGQCVQTRPAFGCGVDPNLKRAMDPLYLKYR